MPPAKRSTTKRRTTTRKKPTARKSSSSKEPAAIARLNKSLDSVQDALNALRKDLSKDVGSSAKSLYKDLEKYVRDARRDSGKLGKAPPEGPREAPEAARRRGQAGAAQFQHPAQASIALHRQAVDGQAVDPRNRTVTQPLDLAQPLAALRSETARGRRPRCRRGQSCRTLTAISAPTAVTQIAPKTAHSAQEFRSKIEA